MFRLIWKQKIWFKFVISVLAIWLFLLAFFDEGYWERLSLIIMLVSAYLVVRW